MPDGSLTLEAETGRCPEAKRQHIQASLENNEANTEWGSQLVALKDC